MCEQVWGKGTARFKKNSPFTTIQIVRFKLSVLEHGVHKSNLPCLLMYKSHDNLSLEYC